MRRNAVLFAVGGAGYSMLEILYRGRTHWTMAVLGGLCLVLLAAIVRARPEWPLWKLSVAGSLAVTAAELAVGVVINRILGWNVWDYSRQPFNLWGQICPLFSAYWAALSYVVCAALRKARRWRAKRRESVGACGAAAVGSVHRKGVGALCRFAWKLPPAERKARNVRFFRFRTDSHGNSCAGDGGM